MEVEWEEVLQQQFITPPNRTHALSHSFANQMLSGVIIYLSIHIHSHSHSLASLFLPAQL
jgi:hypothetical protein